MRNWVLPEYIEDVLPAEAERTEGLRRVLLDHFRTQGYRLVQPPLVEHLDSLFTGTGVTSSCRRSRWSIRCRAACSACARTSRRRSRGSTRTS
jgi:hypothetical protein